MTGFPRECEDASSSILNFLEPIMLISWESIEKSIAVVETRGYKRMNNSFSGITNKVFANPADVS